MKKMGLNTFLGLIHLWLFYWVFFKASTIFQEFGEKSCVSSNTESFKGKFTSLKSVALNYIQRLYEDTSLQLGSNMYWLCTLH